MDKYDSIGCRACSIYEKEGIDGALKYLDENIKDANYEIEFYTDTNTKDSSEKWSSFNLKVFDNKKNEYHTGGDKNYTDDQYFSHDKTKAKQFYDSLDNKSKDRFNKYVRDFGAVTAQKVMIDQNNGVKIDAKYVEDVMGISPDFAKWIAEDLNSKNYN